MHVTLHQLEAGMDSYNMEDKELWCVDKVMILNPKYTQLSLIYHRWTLIAKCIGIKSYGTFLIANTMQSNSVVFLLKKYNLSTDQWSEMPKSI